MSALLVQAAGYVLTPLPGGRWSVRSPSGATYQVDPETGTCTCPDGRARGHKRMCKHSRAILNLLTLVPALNRDVPDNHDLRELVSVMRGPDATRMHPYATGRNGGPT